MTIRKCKLCNIQASPHIARFILMLMCCTINVGVSTFTKRCACAWQVAGPAGLSDRTGQSSSAHTSEKTKNGPCEIDALSLFIYFHIIALPPWRALSHHINNSGGYYRIHINCCQEGKCILFISNFVQCSISATIKQTNTFDFLLSNPSFYHAYN